MDESSREPRFRIGDEERPDTVFSAKEEIPDITKLSHRLNRLSLLLLLLLAAVFGMGYFEINKRFDQIHNQGAQGLHAVSRNIEVRFVSLLEEQEKLKGLMESKIKSLEKRASDLHAVILKAEEQFNAINASKPDKKDLENTASKIDQNMAGFKKALADLSQSMPAAEKKLTYEINQLADAIGKLKTQSTKNQEELQALSVKKLDKAIFDVKLKSEQKEIQHALDKTTSQLNFRLQTLENRLGSYEKKQGVTPSKSEPRTLGTGLSPTVESGNVKEEPIKE